MIINYRLLLRILLLTLVVFSLTSHTAFAAEAYQKVLDTLDNLVSFVLRMAGLACVAVIIYFGVRMVLAGGDDAVYATARKGLNYALLGALVIFSTYTIIATV